MDVVSKVSSASLHPADITGNKTVEFSGVLSNNSMSLQDDKKTISVRCAGPYVLYMLVCYRSIRPNQKSSGLLQLVGSDGPLTSHSLSTAQPVCEGLHSLVYLQDDTTVSLRLVDMGDFKVKSLEVGLRYLLGAECKF